MLEDKLHHVELEGCMSDMLKDVLSLCFYELAAVANDLLASMCNLHS